MPAPALRTITDVLRNADGSLYAGLLEIRWSPGQTPDGSTTAGGRIRQTITAGALSLNLVPATYTVRYLAPGMEATETWVVPTGSGVLTVANIKQ